MQARHAIAVLTTLACLLCSCCGSGPASFENMNGEYLTTPTPHAPRGGPGYNTKWSEYPGGVEYFEVEMGPITTLYSQVWWANLPPVQLPADLIKRFDGRGMSIVGYETDSVRKTAQGDVSVPINMAYNHHHDVYITGKNSKMDKVPYDPQDLTVPYMARSDPHVRDVPVETSPAPSGLPTSLHLADGNGGEYRKSYHGFPSPAAYVIDSPQSVFVNPMFIDTWNRDKMNISGGSDFVAGPLPKRSEAPPGALYSGLLECPLTTRIEKMFPGGDDGWDPTYTTTLFECASNTTRCAHPVGSAEDCFAAAKAAVGTEVRFETSTGVSDDVAAGCTVTYDRGSASAKAFYNTKNESTACCGAGVRSLRGKQSSLVHVEMEVTDGDNVTITLSGPSSVWFGVGFFAQAMEEKPYAIIVEGANGSVSERQLASHMGSAPSPGGILLSPSVTVQSSSEAGGLRTVILTRRAAGATSQHANFTLQDTTIPLINAIGSGPSFGYHANKTAFSLSLWPNAEPACICEQPAAPFGSAQGNIRYRPTSESFGFINACQPEPRESVLAERNPTCDVRAYVGGLQVCKHLWSLLDADQEIPWQDQPLVFYQKYRFYFQPYNATRHVIVRDRAVWAIGAFIGEYDVPACKPGTPPEMCTHEIWGVVTPGGDNLHIAAAHFHCHAPTCIAMEIWNNKTGELMCRQEPVYGGTGRILEKKFDEASLPPDARASFSYAIAPRLSSARK